MKSITGLPITCTIVWIFYYGTTILHAQTIISTSGLQDGNIACPDSVVVFTCVTRGSSAIAWRSDFYVGDQIGFSDGQQVGDTQRSSSNPNTLATLTNNYLNNGVQVLESTLHVVASLSSLNPSVTCVHTDSENTDSFSLKVLADPGMPQEMISIQTMDETEKCVLDLSWSSPSNIVVGHVMTYIIKIDGNNVVNKTNSDNSTRNLFVHPVCTCGPHTVSISAVNICHRVGPSTPDVTLHPKLLSTSLTCSVPEVNTANVATTNVTTEPSSHVENILAIIGSVATIVFAALLCSKIKQRAREER